MVRDPPVYAAKIRGFSVETSTLDEAANPEISAMEQKTNPEGFAGKSGPGGGVRLRSVWARAEQLRG